MKIDKKWLLGFLENSSEFNVYIREKNGNIKEVLLEFSVNSKDIKFLYSLKKFFGCGKVINNNIYVVNRIEHLNDIILAFFAENMFITDKKFEFFKFKRCLEIVSKNARLEDLHIEELCLIRKQISNERTRR